MIKLFAILLLILWAPTARASTFDNGPFGGVSSVYIGQNWFGCMDVEQTPSTPSTGQLKFYCKDNSGTPALYTLDDMGKETLLGSGGGSSGNVSIGTGGYDTIYVGPVGVGTFNVGSGVIRDTGTNVGIGSISPVQALDVQGTGRFTHLVDTGLSSLEPAYTDSNKQLTSGSFSGNTTIFATANGVLNNGDCVSIDSNGNFIDAGGACTVGNGGGTVSSAGAHQIGYYASAGTTISGDSSLVYTGGNVGVGTSSAAGRLIVIGGNVGIGSSFPGQALDVQGTARATAFNTTGAYTQSGSSANTLSGTTTFSAGTSALFGGNVGINSITPGQRLDVQGTVRTTGLTLNLNPNSGYVLVGNSLGVGTWMPASSLPITVPVSSVSNSDGTLFISPTTGGVVASIPSSVALPGSPTTTTQASSDNSIKIATTAYVTTGIANAVAGVNPAVSVQAATTSASDTSGFIYNNGSSGIGATFTGTVNTAVTIDGYTFTTIGQRLLVKNDTQSPSGAFNGIYSLTTLQALAVPPIFTRSLDYNQPSDMNNTGAIPVVNGTVNASTSWLLTSSVTTVGTSPLTYTQFSLNPSTVVNTSGLTTGYIPKATGSTSLGNGSIFDNGNVGINSTVPGARLDVQGTVRVTGIIITTPIPTNPTCSAGGTCTIGSNSTDYAGNVGIGTISGTATITFGHTWNVAPFCVCTANDIIGNLPCTINSISTTSATIGSSSTDANRHLGYICIGPNG